MSSVQKPREAVEFPEISSRQLYNSIQRRNSPRSSKTSSIRVLVVLVLLLLSLVIFCSCIGTLQRDFGPRFRQPIESNSVYNPIIMAVLALPSLPTITSAFLLKLTTSLDDLLWLSPFLSLSPSVQNKLKHSVVYFIICVVVTMLAFIFGTSLLALMESSEGSHRYWNPERCLSVFSASVLFYIARNDYNEWWEENYVELKHSKHNKEGPSRTVAMGEIEPKTISSTNNSNNNSNNNKASQQQLRSRPTASRQSSREYEDPESCSVYSCNSDSDDDSDDDEIRAKIEEASKSLRRFVTVCVMGTLDDMIVFSAFVAGGAGATKSAEGQSMKDNYLALFIGTTFAALLIVTISWFFSEIECFKRMVKKIPMWALLSGIAVYILVMGLL